MVVNYNVWKKEYILKKKAQGESAYATFDTPVDTPLDRIRADRVFQRKLDYATSIGLPPAMAHHAARYGASYAGIKNILDKFSRGCVLTGKPLLDKCRSGDKTAQPFSTIVRPDGEFISNIMWELSRKGKISDAALMAVANAIVAHSRTNQDHTPIASQPPAPIVANDVQYMQPVHNIHTMEGMNYGDRPEPNHVDMGASGVRHADAGLSDYITAAAEYRKRWLAR